MARRLGLSPLARGNRAGFSPALTTRGPIPARTGQPWRVNVKVMWARAYPRSHGATSFDERWDQGRMGLSPLARGNPGRVVVDRCLAGPIPARTGQPTCQRSAGALSRAYPRSHGATGPAWLVGAGGQGLSPLARGNPHAAAGRGRLLGPIPARTGQPVRHVSMLLGWGAYPRSHGATAGVLRRGARQRGLSPLARGNPVRLLRLRGAAGPIPARTGQPRPGLRPGSSRRAYPRSHGATPTTRLTAHSPSGLSPLARGNHAHRGRLGRGEGPIPARTGQPR